MSRPPTGRHPVSEDRGLPHFYIRPHYTDTKGEGGLPQDPGIGGYILLSQPLWETTSLFLGHGEAPGGAELGLPPLHGGGDPPGDTLRGFRLGIAGEPVFLEDYVWDEAVTDAAP